jgi:HPt (histidine-containing phosphotransfer) domain-containing protein
MVDHELNELRREFLEEADEKVREIETALSGNSDGEALGRLAYLAHQLKGSGGSYGYASISADAAEIEKAAEKIRTGEASFAAERGALHRRVQSLRTQITQSARELGSAHA